MKKLFSLLLALTLVMALALPVLAASASILDEAELMTDAERSALEAQTEDICHEYDLDVIILTIDDLNGKSAKRYAEDHYDSSGYAYDGILLLVAMYDREWYILTNGKAAQFFGDWELDRLEDAMLDDLSDGDYYDAFSGYLTAMESCLEDGYTTFEPDYGDDTDSDSGVNILISLVIGLVVAGIAILIMRSGMNTSKAQSGAAEYIKSGSYRLTEHRDMFLYSRVSKIPKPQSSGSSGSRGRSSGGGSRGGRGGRF